MTTTQAEQAKVKTQPPSQVTRLLLILLIRYNFVIKEMNHAYSDEDDAPPNKENTSGSVLVAADVVGASAEE